MGVDMKIGIYVRVSTNGQNTQRQIEELSVVAERMAATEVIIYEDDGISGTKGRAERQALDNLLKAATQRRLDKVLVWSVDRLGRSLKDLVGILEELEQTGVGLYLHKQAIDTTTASGKALFGMLAVFSQFERELIRERINSGLDRARRNGIVLGRRNTTGHLGEQAAQKRQSGLSYRQIAQELNISVFTAHKLVKANQAA
jgi:DNA invertase Pin-like site-specific DNA recombinase